MRKVTFSSDSLPERDRIEATSHILSAPNRRTMVAKHSDGDFHCRLESLELPGLYSFVMRSSAVTVDCAGGGPRADHLRLGFGFDSGAAPWSMSCRDVDTAIHRRGAYLRSMELPCAFRCDAPAGARVIEIPAQEISQRLKFKDCAFARPVLGDTPGLSLLRQYLGALDQADALSDPLGQRLFVGHVYDLMALVLGANADALEQARHGGLRAARLKAAKDFIDAHLLDPDLSDRAVAAQLGVSDRYVRMLFAGEGTSCKSHIDARRLGAAYAMLTNPVWARLKIIDLAYRCGFNDITTFNRQFRARYGMTPSEAREAPPGARSNKVDRR